MYLIHSSSITLRRRSDPFFNIFSSDEEYGGINRPLSFSSPRNLPSSSLRFSTISKNYIFYFEEIFPQFFLHSVEESEPAVFIFRRSADSDFAGKRYDFERNFSTRNKISIDREGREYPSIASLFLTSLFSCGMHRERRLDNIGRGCDNDVLPDLSSTNDGKVLNSK